jgi:hypothetical protein
LSDAPNPAGSAYRRGLRGISRTARAQACSTGAFAHELPIASLSFFPDGNTLISAGQDSLVKFWTIPGGALFRSVSTDAVPVQLAVSPEGKWIAVAMQGGLLEIWSADGQTHRNLVGHSGTVNGVAFTADGTKLVSVSQDHTTRIWSVAEAKLLRTFSDTDAMNEVAVPAAGRVMARGRPAQRGLLVTSGTQVYRRLARQRSDSADGAGTGLRAQSQRPADGGARCHAPVHGRIPKPVAAGIVSGKASRHVARLQRR